MRAVPAITSTANLTSNLFSAATATTVVAAALLLTISPLSLVSMVFYLLFFPF